MPLTFFAAICALLNLLCLSVIYAIMAHRRKNGKSDIQQSRIMLVISSFVVPIVVSILFVVAAIVSQQFLHYPFPVGQRGGGVFIILIVSVATAVFTLLLLLPRIKHRWQD
jgi:uncharacterized BrkB/YihY/UPF0761 family membrane protein